MRMSHPHDTMHSLFFFNFTLLIFYSLLHGCFWDLVSGNKSVPYGREALSIALRQLSDQYPTQPLIRYTMVNYLLTTALLSRGWVPETFRGFHYWWLAP